MHGAALESVPFMRCTRCLPRKCGCVLSRCTDQSTYGVNRTTNLQINAERNSVVTIDQVATEFGTLAQQDESSKLHRPASHEGVEF